MIAPQTYRNRTVNLQTQTVATRKTYSNNFPAGPSTQYGSSASGVTGTVSQMSDNAHPNFRNRIKAGEIIMGDMMLVKTNRNFSPASLFMTFPATNEVTLGGDFASQLIGLISIPNGLPWETISTHMDQSLIEAHAKITEDTVMTSEILVGLGQTANMLRSPFSQANKYLERMFNATKRHYGKTAASVTNANASAWLEYRYGMLPLYLDINQSIKIFNSLLKGLKRRTVVRAGHVVDDDHIVNFTGVQLPLLYSIGWQLWCTGKVDRQRSASISSGVMYEVAPRTLAEELAVQFQLGSSAILPSLWEQIPFSFVGDWFYNVGDWLAASNLPPDVRVKGNWTTCVDQRKDYYSSTDFYTYVSNVKKSGSIGNATQSVDVVYRCCNRDLPALPVTTRRWATVTHALDAASLLLGPVKDLCTLLRK